MFEVLYKKYGKDFCWWSPSDMTSLEQQLQKELVNGHKLFGKQFVALGRSSENDDVLFTDGCRYFIVHLTWSQGDIQFPHYLEFESLSDALSHIEREFLQS